MTISNTHKFDLRIGLTKPNVNWLQEDNVADVLKENEIEETALSKDQD